MNEEKNLRWKALFFIVSWSFWNFFSFFIIPKLLKEEEGGEHEETKGKTDLALTVFV